jgi:hypothetical protein
MDIFKKYLWYTYKEERFKWFRLTLDQVQEIIQLNKNDEKSISLEEYESEIEIPEKVSFEDAVGQDSLTRFDAPKTSKRRRNNRKKKPVSVSGNLPKDTTQKQHQNRKPNQNPNQKPRPATKPNQPKENQPRAEGTKVNKPRRNNRNRNNNKPENGNNSQEK